MRTPRLYDIGWTKPHPLVPRRLRFEVPERIAADGSVVRPLDLEALRGLAETLAEQRVESVAVCFLNAYVNAAHELAAKEVLREALPNIEVSVSSEVLPEIKEFERTSTTAADAYIKPKMRRYLDSLRHRLDGANVTCPVFIMQSNGGVQDIAATAERPVYAIESGPAAGVIATRWLAERAGIANAISFDMGGTTAKASIIEEGRLSYSEEFEVGGDVSRNSRLIKGSGYLLRTPVIDIAEVGAGGGSIAWVDGGGGLRVGPRGAGANPGPACYGQGGDKPTVTDANVILGYINPNSIAGGAVPLDRNAAERSMKAEVAEPTSLDIPTAAFGVHEIANANMARAVRAVSTERGRDVRNFHLVAFGGSGPIHAAALAREFDIRAVLIPLHPGLFSAFGLLFADITRHFVHTVPGSRVGLDKTMFTHFDGLEASAAASPAPPLGDRPADVAIEWFADLRYRGQGHELRIPIPRGGEELAAIEARFAAEHERLFGHDKPGAPVEVVNLRLVTRAANPWTAERFEPTLPETVPAERARAREERECYFGPLFGNRWTPVHSSRSALGQAAVAGPLIVEEYDATILVPPDFTARCDPLGNVWLEHAP